jgi:hypothetical protein
VALVNKSSMKKCKIVRKCLSVMMDESQVWIAKREIEDAKRRKVHRSGR